MYLNMAGSGVVPVALLALYVVTIRAAAAARAGDAAGSAPGRAVPAISAG